MTRSAHKYAVGCIAPKQPFSIPRGIKPSGVFVHIVCGAPGSGKSTFVKQNAKPNDLIIDFDDIRKLVGGSRYDNNPMTLRKAYGYRDFLLHSLAHRRHGEAWLVVMAPTQEERRAWTKALAKVEIHEINTDAEECKRRICDDPDREGQRERLYQAVDVYFA